MFSGLWIGKDPMQFGVLVGGFCGQDPNSCIFVEIGNRHTTVESRPAQDRKDG